VKLKFGGKGVVDLYYILIEGMGDALGVGSVRRITFPFDVFFALHDTTFVGKILLDFHISAF